LPIPTSLSKKTAYGGTGTYHHSLMVGNLAEAATEAIGGNALLARVGAYFTISESLKAQFLYGESNERQSHDDMTANLSALVITSHIHDGNEMAKKYKYLSYKDIFYSITEPLL